MITILLSPKTKKNQNKPVKSSILELFVGINAACIRIMYPAKYYYSEQSPGIPRVVFSSEEAAWNFPCFYQGLKPRKRKRPLLAQPSKYQILLIVLIQNSRCILQAEEWVESVNRKESVRFIAIHSRATKSCITGVTTERKRETGLMNHNFPDQNLTGCIYSKKIYAIS